MPQTSEKQLAAYRRFFAAWQAQRKMERQRDEMMPGDDWGEQQMREYLEARGQVADAERAVLALEVAGHAGNP